MKNYRPVSNLSFISKVLEKVVASRIQAHIVETNASNPFQSAYKKYHSTETALLRIQNDVLMAMDKGKVTALTLLDLHVCICSLRHHRPFHTFETIEKMVWHHQLCSRLARILSLSQEPTDQATCR